MPIGQNQEARNRYLQAVEVRDRNPQMPFTSMATLLGYQRASNARHAWIQGLRILGRENEIPATRQVRVRTSHGTATVTIDELEGFVPFGDYTFGLEIETVALTRSECETALNGAGILAYDEDYNHHTRAHWKIVRDSSLSHRRGTAEVVSPVLRGANGANELRSVMKVLRDAGAKTNSSCGMHLHIGVAHLHATIQAEIIRQHQVWESAFDSLVLERRIGGRWAQKRTKASADRLATRWVAGLDAGVQVSRSEFDRYFACNIASFHKYGTFEFRQHHGSLNGKSATAWVALHVAFVEAVARGILCLTSQAIINTLTDEQVLAVYGQTSLVGEQREQVLASARATLASLIDNGRSVPRQVQVYILHLLANILYGNGLLTAECATYLRNRAGNLPTSATNRNV